MGPHMRMNSSVNPVILLITLLATGFLLQGACAGQPSIAGCAIFPADNIWNTRVDTLPVAARSADYIRSIGTGHGLHPDFGSGTWDGGPIGIPYQVVGADQRKSTVTFYYPDESDPGPYPVPDHPLTEWGSDHHVILLDPDARRLYEMYDVSQTPSGGWSAGWTSADAAGLPILPGLVRYDEVTSGEITHAIRFTAPDTQGRYIWPARHQASDLPGTSIPRWGSVSV
jgi:hypothetical protein